MPKCPRNNQSNRIQPRPTGLPAEHGIGDAVVDEDAADPAAPRPRLRRRSSSPPKQNQRHLSQPKPLPRHRKP
jgi:hypothetical protein